MGIGKSIGELVLLNKMNAMKVLILAPQLLGSIPKLYIKFGRSNHEEKDVPNTQ